MNCDTQLKGLVDDLPEPLRSQAVSALLRCNFVSADDPTLGLLAVLKIRAQAKQPNHTAAPAHRAAERVEQAVWRLERWKWRNLIFSWLFFGGLGIGLCGGALWFLAVKEPKTLQAWLRLQSPMEYRTVTDGRMLRLNQNTVSWEVLEDGQKWGFFMRGVSEPKVKPSGTNWVITFLKNQ